MIVNDKFGRIWRELLTSLTQSQYLIVVKEGIPSLRQQRPVTELPYKQQEC